MVSKKIKGILVEDYKQILKSKYIFKFSDHKGEFQSCYEMAKDLEIIYDVVFDFLALNGAEFVEFKFAYLFELSKNLKHKQILANTLFELKLKNELIEKSLLKKLKKLGLKNKVCNAFIA